MWIEFGCLRCHGDLTLIKDEDGEALKCFQCGYRFVREKREDIMIEKMAPKARGKYIEDHKAGIVASLYLLGWVAGAAEWGIGKATMHRLKNRWKDVNWSRVWKNKPGRVKGITLKKPAKVVSIAPKKTVVVTKSQAYARGYRQCIIDIMTISKAKLEKLGGE